MKYLLPLSLGIIGTFLTVLFGWLLISSAAYAQTPDNEYVMGKLNWTQLCFRITNITATATVQVTDPDMNKFPSSTDIVKIFVYSDSYPEGITITLYETSFDSGIFERTFGLSDKRSAPNVLYTQEGDTITAKYIDSTLPLSHNSSDQLELNEAAFIGCSSPPLERVPASAARFADSAGNTIDNITTGKQVHITSDIANGQTHEQKFAWIAQIADERNKIVSLGWIDGVLNPESAFSPSASWIPEQEGRYTATMFVWESLDNPTALSPPISIDLEVKPENPKIPRTEDDNSEFKYPKLDEGIITWFSHTPLKQFESGIPLNEIKCKEGLDLAVKKSNGRPICITNETKTKLEHMGLLWSSWIGASGEEVSENGAPFDFSLVYSFGISGKNVLDSAQNRFFADMICDPPIGITINLSDTEKQAIWQSVLQNDFFSFGNFTQNCDESGQCLSISPEEFTTLSITGNGKMHTVQHRGSYLYNDNENYLKFEEITEIINNILRSRDNFENLPSPRCAYQ